MTTQFRHMKQVLVASSIAFLTLAGCESDSSSSSTPTGFLGTTTLTGTSNINAATGFIPFVDAGITANINARDAFRVTETTIDEFRNRITVNITGETENTQTALMGDLDDMSRIDDNPAADDITAIAARAQLTFELNEDIEDGETSLLGTENAPEWTIVRGTDNIFYRNRARRVANDHNARVPAVLEQDDPNYVEYHAMTYVGATPAATADEPNPTPPEIVRVEVVLIPNYDDGVPRLGPRRNAAGQFLNADGDIVTEAEAEIVDVNANALEGENIALGLRFATASQTRADDDNLPSGQVSYTGRYMGQNRFTFTNDEAFDPGTNVGEIPADRDIVAKEANAPRMTITATFGTAQRASTTNPPVSFTIHEAELTVDQTVGNVEVDGTMTVEIRGTAQLTPDEVNPLQFDNGRITNVNGVNLPLTFTQGTGAATRTATLTLNPGNLTTDADGEGNFVTTNNSVIGMFFDNGNFRASAVAGLIDFEAGVDHTQSISGANVEFTLRHEMLGVFLAERDLR